MDKNKLLLIVIFFIMISRGLHAGENSILERLGGLEKVVKQFVPEQEFIKNIKHVEYSNNDFFPLLTRDELSFCSDTLIPIFKSQKEKEYHLKITVEFDRRLLSGLSLMCNISQRATSKCNRFKGATKRACLKKNLRCLMDKRFVITVLSDVYEDSCGKQVRGFALKSYTKPGEEMGSLVSPGHRIEVAQRFSGGVNSYRDLEPIAVDIDDFMFFNNNL